MKKLMNSESTSSVMSRWLGGVGTIAFYVGKGIADTTDTVGVKVSIHTTDTTSVVSLG